MFVNKHSDFLALGFLTGVDIKKIYQHAGKCDDQQNLKDIIDAAILSTPEGVTDNIPNVNI